MKLYEIKGYMMDTLDIFLESDQDEVDQELYEETMEYLKEELQNKSSKLIKYISNLEGEVTASKLEIERLTKVKKARESKISSLKKYMLETMKHLDKSSIDIWLGSLGIRKSTSLEVMDIEKIPEEYIKPKTSYSVDKREVTRMIKEGQEVAGARLVTNYSLLIK